MIRLITAVLFVGALFACSAETQTSAEAPEAVAINEMCPGMGEPVDAEAGTYDWNGKTVGFCCEGCIGKFEKLSDDDKVAALAKVGTEVSEG